MKKKKMTLEDLAVMTQNGFSELGSTLRSEMKEGFDAIDKRFEGVDARLDGIDIRLDRIENLLLRAHENRLEKLEDDVRVLKTSLKK